MIKPVMLAAAIAAMMAGGACNAEKSGGSASPSGPVKPVKAPNGDWSQMVSATSDGGMLMGNPNAKVKLVEYGSMTCPHCRDFDAEGSAPLVEKYVKSGRISYEFRNYVRDADDLAAALIARCSGPNKFFPLTHALYAFQKEWVAKIMAIPQARQQALMNLPPNQQFLQIAQTTGLQQWAAMRGLPSARSSQCLANQAEVDRLVSMNGEAGTTYNIPGTPAFIINGKLADGATWEALEPQLKTAIGR